MKPSRFQELLEKAKAAALAAKSAEEITGIDRLNQLAITADKIDLASAGITAKMLANDAGQEQAVDIIRDIAANVTRSEPEPPRKPADILTTAIEETLNPKIGVQREITLNDKQQEAHDLVVHGSNDLVFIGAAGTGKTTSMKKTTASVIATGKVKPLKGGTKWLHSGSPGAVVVSFTRKAVNNIRHAVVDELKIHTQTLHKFLEFAPIFYEVIDDETGKSKKTMRFEPQRNASNPLPPDLVLVVIEESSMVSVELHEMWKAAMPHPHQTVYIGDIQQLPPVFGLAILGFKMIDTQIVELTEVYRQALESPIITLAWKILEGDPNVFSSRTETYTAYSEVLKKDVKRIRVPALEVFNRNDEHGTVKFQIWQKQLSPDDGLNTFVKQAVTWADHDYYNPQEDIILCPFNKAFGTIEINKGIAQHLAVGRQAVVHEIIAGFDKHYLAVGDRVMYDKEDAFIVDIVRNDEYLGKAPQPASIHLDRWGHYRENLTDAEKLSAQTENDEMDLAAMENFMAAAVDKSEDRVQSASHRISIRYAYAEPEDQPIELSSAGEINNLLGGYAITVHKAQGSEWGKVFLVLSHCHAVMNQRELLYTAVTRARNFLHIICEPNTFEKGLRSQRIQGNTLAEKAEFFKGKQDVYDKKKFVHEGDAADFKSAVYKGDAPKEVAVFVPAIKKCKLYDMSKYVPASIIQETREQLAAVWEQAKRIWGAGLGDAPTFSYDLQTHKTLGLAYPAKKHFKLNPVWCILAETDPRVKEEMLVNTLKHEVAHIIEGVYSKGAGHGSGWRMTMQLLGLKPEVYYTGDTLPNWADSYQEVIKQLVKAKTGADEIEDEQLNDGEVA